MDTFEIDSSEILQPHDWTTPIPIAYGPGRLKEIGDFCKSFEINNPLLVTDNKSKDLAFIETLERYLSNSGLDSEVFYKISPNPRDDEIEKGCEIFKMGRHDAIIAIGGGSAMDGGKAVCLTVNNEIPLWDFEWEKPTPKIGKRNPFPKLVNNAGYGIATPFHVTSIEDEENFIRVLGTSVITLTKLFVKDMIKQKSGKIMIVSSVAAFAPPSAIQVLYGPIKTFMNRFSDAMNSSYNRLGITSTAVCPGFTVTNFHTASNVQEMMDAVPSFMKFSAERIAKEGVEAMFKGKSLCVPTKTYRFLVFLLRVTPYSFIRLLENVLAPGRYEHK